ncbi:MAG: zinc-dependent metalloprotease family protein [Gemmatimonadota bacterium]|jgi:hypothetical protein
MQRNASPRLAPLLALLLCGLAVGPSAAQAPAALFAASPPGAPPLAAMQSALPPGTVRANQVLLRRSVLGALTPGQEHRISLPLFADRVPVARLFERHAYGATGFVWVGELEGVPHSEVYVSVSGDDVYVKVRAPGRKSAEVSPLGGEIYRVIETDHPEQPFEEEEALDAAATFGSGGSGGGGGDGVDASASETHIDVVIFYTDDARAAAGGTGAIVATAQAAVSQANTGHANSGTQARLRLVHTQEVAYAEGGNITNDLNALASTTDGIMDQVHAVRDQYGADLVHLFTESTSASGSTIGLARTSGDFAVTKRSRALDLTFEHEVGHNLGMCHQLGASASSWCTTPGYTGNAWEAIAQWVDPIFGFVICSGRAVTVMWNTAGSDNINWWSDPGNTITFSPPLACADGGNIVRPLGTSTSNNTGQIRVRRSLYADNRQAEFYVQAGAGEGNATQSSPENDVGDVFNQWFPLTEVNPGQNAEVYISAGTYPQAVFLNQKADLLRWGSSGSVILGQ